MLRERYDHLSTIAVHSWQWIFDDEPNRHVVIISTTADWDSQIWLQAAEDIYCLLRASGIHSDITVELTNEGQLNYRKITAKPVPQSDREFYSKIKKKIFETLLQKLETTLVYAGLYIYSKASSVST